jgi:hypothetical protein
MKFAAALFEGFEARLDKEAAAAQGGGAAGQVAMPLTPKALENMALTDKLTNIQLKMHLQNAEEVMKMTEQEKAQEAEEQAAAEEQQAQAQAQAEAGGATPGVPQGNMANNPVVRAGVKPGKLPVDPQSMIGAM